MSARATSEIGGYPTSAEGKKVKAEHDSQGSQQANSTPPLRFAREDWSLYVSLKTLPQRAGVPSNTLPWLVAKEATDNALDSTDAAGRPGQVTVFVENGNLTVEDQGTGITDATPESLATIFCVARPMLSSKLLRRPSRGSIGNGLRVICGYLTATRALLMVETGSVRVKLSPETDGQSHILSAEAIEPRQGLKLTAVHGEAPFEGTHLSWAEDAIELAKRSGQPAYTGRPSVHWHDADNFLLLLRSVVGNVTIRQFLGEFDGLSGSKVQSKVAGPFLRRFARELSDAEGRNLLALAQQATKPPKAKALRPLGRDAVLTDGYAMAEGSLIDGALQPKAEIPFLVECWCDAAFPEQQESSEAQLYMNRTKAPLPCSARSWHSSLDIRIGAITVGAQVPAGPHYNVTINITSPMYPVISDGKQPDVRPFSSVLAEVVRKAAQQAGRDIASLLSAADRQAERQAEREARQEEREEEQAVRIAQREARAYHKAQIAERKAARQKLPSIKEVVLELLPGAISKAADGGYLFNTRHVLYNLRDEVQRRSGEEIKQSYFDDLVTEIENEQGDLHPNMIREARGNYSIPHLGLTIPLGTLNVRQFIRPSWTFNKIVCIEKEDLRLMLQLAGWDRRHDAMLMSAKGFDTRAAKDLIDKNVATSEPLDVFTVHDADAAGTRIAHALQYATPARGERTIKIIDLGLQPWEGISLGLAVEKVPVSINKRTGKPRRRAVGDYVRARSGLSPVGNTWEEWLQTKRIELNAFSPTEMIVWLDRKMIEHGACKLIPPGDILQDQFSERVRERAESEVETAISSRLGDVVTIIGRKRDNDIAIIRTEEATAKRPILDEIDRVSAPILTELARVRAPFLAQLAAISKPIRARIAEVQETHRQRSQAVHEEADNLDRTAITERVIRRMTPDADKLRTGIGDVFAEEPAQHWERVLHEIADATEVGEVDIDLGDGNHSPDDDGEGSEP